MPSPAVPRIQPQSAGHGRPGDRSAADLYEVISRRRDVRAQFTGAAVPLETVLRILGAAHAAPSVGMSQPWDFILVTDPGTRSRFQSHVAAQRTVFAESLTAEQSAVFAGIKIEGIMQSSLGIVVTNDPDRGAPAVLGRHAIPDTSVYSTCLAIQNLWLAATAEGLGVGWVSFYSEPFLQQLLDIPSRVRPVAWLCVGPVTHLETVPDLERLGWRGRRPLAEAVHHGRYSSGGQ